MKLDWQARLKHVENWHLVVQENVVHVGSPERLLVLDEAPPRSGQKVLGGRAGRRLAELLGFENREELLENVDAFNLLPAWPGKTKTGKVLFPMRSAKREWNCLRFEASSIIFLDRVAKMSGLGTLTEVKTHSLRFLGLPNLGERWWYTDNVDRACKVLKPWAVFAHTGRWPR